jgi:hypothetical protein
LKGVGGGTAFGGGIFSPSLAGHGKFSTQTLGALIGPLPLFGAAGYHVVPSDVAVVHVKVFSSLALLQCKTGGSFLLIKSLTTRSTIRFTTGAANRWRKDNTKWPSTNQNPKEINTPTHHVQQNAHEDA